MKHKTKLTQISLFAALCVGSFGAACDKGDTPKAEAGAAKADGGEAPKAEAGEAKADGGEVVATADPETQAAADKELSDDLTGLDPKVQKAVSIARAIEAKPDSAEDVLASHELDREGLDALMYEIARNPELSRAYRDARMAS